MSKQAQKNIFMLVLILLGGAVILSASSFPKNPGGIGPGFYPTITGVLLIGFCAIELLLGAKEQENQEEIERAEKRQNFLKLVNVIISMIVCVLVMQYVHVLLAILLFLFYYLKCVADISLKSSLLISAGGTAVLYAAIILLKIPL